MGTRRVRLESRHVTATQTTLIWLNLAGAFAAMLTNARAAATPHPRDRFEFGMAATLATPER